MNRRAFLIVILSTVCACSVLLGFYLFAAKFVRDRNKALSFHLPTQKREVKTYHAKELEEARKKGELPQGAPQPYVPPRTENPGDAAIQRNLRTIEEINRINEMNRRLQEQQQRMQNQR